MSPFPRVPDQTAFQRLCERLGGPVYHRARKVLGEERGAREVRHEVFLRILQSEPRWDPPSPVAWQFKTTTHLCLNVLRDRRRRLDLLAGLPAHDPHAPGLPISILLAGVPTELHEVAVFHCWDGMSEDEIALVLGVSGETVSNLLKELNRRNLEARRATQPACPSDFALERLRLGEIVAPPGDPRADAFDHVWSCSPCQQRLAEFFVEDERVPELDRDALWTHARAVTRTRRLPSWAKLLLRCAGG